MIYNRIATIQQRIAAKDLLLTDLVEHYLDKIHVHADLNAFLEVFDTEARTRAAEIQSKMEAGTAGKLAGLVIGLKDNICYKNHQVTCASKILEGYISVYHATVVEKLLQEDAIIIGRLNCDEFAMGSSNESSYFGPVKHPLDQTRVPGGSSGGSAVAVAAGLCHAALGSDTGGSIRQPASFCGIVGLKPSYGRVSRYGLLAYGSSFDQIGPMTHSVEDAALILEVIAGKDPHDSTSSAAPVANYTAALTKKTPLRIAVLKDCVENPGVSPAVKKHFLAQLKKLETSGHTIDYVDFPFLDYLVPAYYVLSTAEASSNLSRYDGIHFGYRSAHGTDLNATYKLSRSEGFGKEVKRRIMLGTFVLSSGYYDAYYTKGQQARRLLYDATKAILENHDLIAMPTTPGTAFKFGQKSDDPVAMYLEDIFTVHANLVGVPAISIPMGKDEQGLPTGFQFMGKWQGEATLLAAAMEICEQPEEN